MKNWSTDTTKFKSLKVKRIWELSQLINYGLDGTKVDLDELKLLWTNITPHLQPETRRLWEYWLWHRAYSLHPTTNFWNPLPKKLI